MRIGLAYNQKPDTDPTPDASRKNGDVYAEWDEPSTIDAVEQALGLFGSVIRLHADATFPQKLATARFAMVHEQVDLARVRLPYPLFVKPVAEGSGKGIFANNLCQSRAQLRE